MINDENQTTLSANSDLNTRRTSAKGSEEQQIKEAIPVNDALTNCLMEKICEASNLNRAYKRVKANKGAPGVDRMKVDEMRNYIAEHKEEFVKSLLEGHYRPKPVREVEIPKAGGGVRQLGIPTVMDRLVQQAILQILEPIFDREFSESSYGFRLGRSAHQAVQQAQNYVQAGYRVVVDVDIEKFFNRVNHDILMSKLAKRISDKRLLKLIRAFLTAGIMSQGICREQHEGTPQGGPLSPLLSNIMLDELDKELEERGHKFCRYADDCNIYVKTQMAGERVMASIKKFLNRKLRLTINEMKSGVAHTSRRQFLGFCLLSKSKIGIAPKSKERVKQMIKQLTKRNRGVELEKVIAELNQRLKGWLNYYKLATTLTTFSLLDRWIRRRLRSYRLKQRKKSCKSIAAFLIGLGVCRHVAWNTAKSGKGYWRISKSPAFSQAMSTQWFSQMGLINLESRAKMVKL